MNFLKRIIPFGAVLAAASFLVTPVWAGTVNLPAGLEWCQSRDSAEAKLKNPREANDDVVESAERVYRVDGFVSAIFEQDQLIKVSVRFYETETNVGRVRSAMSKMLGEGTSSGSTTRWATASGDAQFKVQTEQIYSIYTAPAGRCVFKKSSERGDLSDQEKADLEALKKKQAVEWDPYAMDEDDDEEKPIVERKKTEKEKKAEERQKKEEAEEDLEDEDIDW